MNSEVISFHASLDAACAQQDYLWFLAIVAGAGVLVAWWYHPQRHEHAWLAWGAGMAILHGSAGIATFISPVLERTNPPPGAVGPHIAADLFMGATAALMAMGWWWQATWSKANWRLLRWTGLVLFVSACWLRKDHPTEEGWALAGSVTVMFLPLVARHRGVWFIVAGVLMISSAWLSPWGPVAAINRVLQRGREWSILSVVCAALLAAGQVSALGGLLREMVQSREEEARKQLWPGCRPFVLVACAWLVAGLFMATIAGAAARSSFEAAALSRVGTAAAVLDPGVLEETLGPKFHPAPVGRSTRDTTGKAIPFLKAESVTMDRTALVMAQLKRFFQLNPDLVYVLIVRPYADQLFRAIPMAQLARESGMVYSQRPLLPADRQRWSNGTPHLEIGTTPRGTMFMARAALRSTSGGMLGWLQFDFSVGQWAAAQAQARLLTFIVVAMGLGLVGQLLIRQWREREREAALRTAVAADQANRMKSTFLATVSHELRTPLQSVLGYTELLRSGVHGEVAQARLAALRQHGELMIRLVNDLIDLGMLESGSFRLVEKTFSLPALIRETTESLRPRAEAKGLELECQLDPALPVWVVSDPERLRQVLLNLLGNAVKYTDRGGVYLQVEQKAETGSDICVELQVRDTGPGIPPAEQHRLFEPFSRLRNAELKEGAGLGLALAAGLCRRLGGQLTVESDGVAGSVFRTVFNLRAGAPPAAPRFLERGALAGWRILVADDNSLVRELFVAYLSEIGAECVVAADGPTAVARAADTQVDAIILDLAMPGFDGVQVARHVRAAGGRQRIIGVSAHGGSVERAEALAAGMDDFLLKPVELPVLAATLAPATAAVPPPSDFWIRRRTEWEATLRRELPELLTKMRAALEQSDWEILQRDAHHLKNSAVVVRDDTLFRACGDVEAAAMKEDLREARLAFDRCLRTAERWTNLAHIFSAATKGRFNLNVSP